MKESPSTWLKLPFSKVAEVVTGTTPQTKIAEYYGGTIPFVTPGDLNAFSYIKSTSSSLTQLGVSKARILPAESTMVCCIGSLGKVGFAGIELVTNQQINSLIFDKDKVYPRYGFHFCKTLKPLLEQIAPNTTLPIINKSRFSEIEIPLPPLPEQKRIAAILDKADALREHRRQAIAKLDELLQSVFIDMFGDPVTNPKGWSQSILGDIAEVSSGAMKGRKFNGQQTVFKPYLRVANVQDSFLDLREIKLIEVAPNDVEKYRLKCGDVLMTEGGDPDKLGRGAIWSGEIAECLHQNHIYKVRVNDQILKPEYLSALTGSEAGKRYFLRQAKQTTGIATINMTQLRKFPVSIPPLALQQQYIKSVNALNSLRRSLEKSHVKSQELFQSFQQRAFTGELFTQEGDV